ncbi:hypothetical protein ACFQ1S_17170, partial [Kibdelosporangium lantanae]
MCNKIVRIGRDGPKPVSSKAEEKGVVLRFPLNPAQLRNLRNWAVVDLPGKTLRVSVSVTPPTSPAVARDALATLAGMHDALRSRLVREADGGLVQEVVDGAEMIVDEIESTPNPHPVDIRPEEHAARARLHMRGDAVVVVELTVSHVFCDGMGRQV